MKIIYDYQAFLLQQYGGVSRYIYEVATRIAKNPQHQVKILAGAYINQYLKNCDSSLVLGLSVPIIPRTPKILEQINSKFSRLWLAQNTPNIVHETYYFYERLAPKNSKTIITVHDFTHEKFSHLFPQKGLEAFIERKANAIKRADHIICVSENTKNDLIELLKISSDKVSVVYHGSSLPIISKSVKNYPGKPYIFYVGQRGVYKNFDNFLKAYANSEKIKKDFDVTCFGGGSFTPEELALVNQLGLTEEQVQYVSGNDQTLAKYYQNAALFIYPSLYEGFGIPLVEAMSQGCPIACSNTSSMPEVVEQTAQLFDPHHLESIQEALETVLYSPSRRDDLVRLGMERVKQFSWDICAQKTLEVYEKVLAI